VSISTEVLRAASLMLVLACGRAPAPAPSPPVPEPSEAALKAELALARTPQVYLVLDLARREISVRSRGREFGALHVEDVAFERWHPPLGGRGAAPPPALPLAVKVVGDDPPRSLEAPELASLRPAGSTASESPPAAATPPPPNGAPLLSELPYWMPLDNGWRLYVDARPPLRGPGGRWIDTVAYLFTRLSGRSARQPDRLVVVVSPADADWLRHLLRPGRPLLIY